MSQKELHQLIRKLQEEVEDLEIKSDAQQELSSLIKEIEDQADAYEIEKTHGHLLDNIKTYIEKFEAEHPRMTNILSEIMIKISNIGI